MKNRMLVGTRKGLMTFCHNGKDWEFEHEQFAGIPVSYATRDPRNGTMWACLDHGHWGAKLHRSLDNGATWDEIVAPKYPDGEIRPDDGQPANTSYIWKVQPGGNDQPNRVYFGTEPGGLFVSDDNGDTIELMEGLWTHPSRNNWFGGGRDHAGTCSIIVDPRDSNHLTIGISVGGVYESTDGGKTWDGRNKGLFADFLPNPYAEYGHDPHYMLASPSNPDVLWQQNHCGVFRSTDGGKNWKDLSQKENLIYFGFALAVDPKDEKVAWVIPAISAEYRVPINRSLCVCRTDDGGETWQDFRAGLPQNNCYDIAFRHSLDIDSDRLAFGTTAGNLYVSNDRGESWQSISNNMAVIYSVQFVDA